MGENGEVPSMSDDSPCLMISIKQPECLLKDGAMNLAYMCG